VNRAINFSQLMMVAILSSALSAGVTYMHLTQAGEAGRQLAGFIEGALSYARVRAYALCSLVRLHGVQA